MEAEYFINPYRLYGVTHTLDGSRIRYPSNKKILPDGGWSWMIANAICGGCEQHFIAQWKRLTNATKKDHNVYCSVECRNLGHSRRTEELATAWRGGLIIDGHGYRAVRLTGHPRANSGYVSEHILLAEEALGKPLPKGAHVHHFNEVKSDNSRGNLVICQDGAYHRLLHARQRVARRGGNPDLDKICCACKALKPKQQFGKSKDGWDGRRSRCSACKRVESSTRNLEIMRIIREHRQREGKI